MGFKHSAALAAVSLLSFSSGAPSGGQQCKAVPGSISAADWQSLNKTISGQLLSPPPPAALCHPDQPTYNADACTTLQKEWSTSAFHVAHPISNLWNNWNNDTCIPDPTAPCSGEGYPDYVVNALSPQDVKAGVDFARKHNVRLVVKGTGHDYIGRSQAPNSLSIWTYNMKGISFFDKYTPKGCKASIDTPAVKVLAGENFGRIDEAASGKGLTVVSGGASTVGIGGFLTGGGHSVFSPYWGLAVDNIYEMEMVTPSGQILTVNECQNQDLFWAMRGGGGSTFGVLTSATMRAWPSPKFATVTGDIIATSLGNPHYWDVVANVIAGFPSLIEQGITGYGHIGPNFTGPQSGSPTPLDLFDGAWNMALFSPENTTASFEAAIGKLYNDSIAPYPGEFVTIINGANYTDFWGWYKDKNGPLDAGYDLLLGSRLLTPAELEDKEGTKAAFKAFIPPVSGAVATLHLVSGPGVWNAKPRGGSDSVNPAWRKSMVHTTTEVTFPPNDPAAKAKIESYLTNVLDAPMREFAPDTGAYVNEADPNEPNWQTTFWGDNYARLLSIKKKVDPSDVFWCSPCVGNENWEVVDDVLCKK